MTGQACCGCAEDVLGKMYKVEMSDVDHRGIRMRMLLLVK